jgi:manganese/iron transport system permease protein/iron/zinc/copper transport system permease protein
MLLPLQYDFFVRAILVGTLVGGLCGLIGVYVVLRRMAYIGHGLSHSIFGGAVVSYIMSINFFIGASLWGFLSAILITITSKKTNVSSDSSIGIITTASFALGIALISRYKNFTRSFDAALFGNILGVTKEDLISVIFVALLVSIVVFVIYKYLLFTTFDPVNAAYYGVSVGWVDTVFSLIMAATVVVSLQILGVTMIASTIIIPPVIARILTSNFNKMVIISVLLGAFSSLVGLYLSFYLDISSGPAVVLFSSFLFIISLIYSAVNRKIRTLLVKTKMD